MSVEPVSRIRIIYIICPQCNSMDKRALDPAQYERFLRFCQMEEQAKHDDCKGKTQAFVSLIVLIVERNPMRKKDQLHTNECGPPTTPCQWRYVMSYLLMYVIFVCLSIGLSQRSLYCRTPGKIIQCKTVVSHPQEITTGDHQISPTWVHY